MKKLISTLMPCIIACLLLSSCGSRVSIVKRHYRGGYYVEYTKKAPATTLATSKETRINPPQRINVASIPYPERQSIIKGTFVSSNQPISFETVAVPENMHHKNVHPAIKQLLSSAGITKAPEIEIRQSLSEGTIGSAGHDGDGAGAALSLLWIVIVIILIIWLVGILAGGWGGGLLNLLLVIALILLILWLLRII